MIGVDDVGWQAGIDSDMAGGSFFKPWLMLTASYLCLAAMALNSF